MEIKNMKNIVVLKDLPSNMIDEAFVILKENVKIHNMQKTSKEIAKKEEKNINKDRGYLIKEAETIVNEYATNLSNKNENKAQIQIKKLENRCAKLKAATIFFGGFSLLCIINYIAMMF